ncbi:MAG: LUD domain-containing protein [Bacteroidetes bacterium]|nr:LUD domain-containing protein [Bacteroidota bacterium]
MSARENLYAALAGMSAEPSASDMEKGAALQSLQHRLRALEFGKRGADVDLFLFRAAEAGTKVHRCSSLQEAASLLSTHIGTGKHCILASDPLIDRMELSRILAGNQCHSIRVTDADLGVHNADARHGYAAADFGITVAQAGLADSGAILISSSQNESRSVSLLPVEHVALLPADRIVPSLLQAAPMLRAMAGDGGTSAATLVGGPSKTADIEKVLVTGVHGPAVLTIIVIENTV